MCLVFGFLSLYESIGVRDDLITTNSRVVIVERDVYNIVILEVEKNV